MHFLELGVDDGVLLLPRTDSLGAGLTKANCSSQTSLEILAIYTTHSLDCDEVTEAEPIGRR